MRPLKFGLCASLLFLAAPREPAGPEGSNGFDCLDSQDMLVDWFVLGHDLSSVMDELAVGGNVMLQYWKHVRPQVHTLDNIARFTASSDTFASCRIGYFAVKAFHVAFSPEREHMLLEGHWGEDWAWFVSLSGDQLADVVQSKWGYVLFQSWQLLATPVQACEPDCPQLQALRLLERGQADEALAALQSIDHSGDLGLLRLLTSQVPLPQFLLQLAIAKRKNVVEACTLRVAERRRCRLKFCPLHQEATPVNQDCSCQRLFPQTKQRLHTCIFMVDSRPVEPMSNITEVLAARFWSLAFEANRLYAEHHGYSIEYITPTEATHYPSRKVGWGKVAVILENMEARLPDAQGGCDIAVSIDTDAYFRGTERLEGVVEQYMQGKEIFFSQEYHTEANPGHIHANGGFFIVRNSEAGRGLLRAWYDVPEAETHKQYKRENPQGLNFCWDSVMQPENSEITALAPFELFSCPRGQFVRHNWFKDLSFEAELQEVVLQRRLEVAPGCVLCDEFHLIDMVRQHDRAVHGKAWVNNR